MPLSYKLILYKNFQILIGYRLAISKKVGSQMPVMLKWNQIAKFSAK